MNYNEKNPFLRKVAVEMLCVVFVGFCLSVVSCNKPNQEELNFNSKEELDSTEKGYVTFGSNSGIINCISYITVFVDGENIGTLQGGIVDSISDCGMDGNITKEIPTGKHTYKVEIRPPNGGGCMEKDITGTFQVSENKCTKIFIDYRQIFGKNN